MKQIKDKAIVNVPEFSFSKSKVGLIAVVIIFLGFGYFQNNSLSKFKNENKELRETNETLETENTTIKGKVKQDSLLIVQNQIKIDTLMARDQIRIEEHFKLKRKYDRLKINYNSATNDVKNELFTKLINN